MPRPFRFAIQSLQLRDPVALATAARQIEALGYDEIYAPDHVGGVDPFIPLMVAAGATTRLRVGSLVLNNEFHHPALLARAAATVDRLTGGRLVLGLGTGYMQSEHDATGIPLREPAQRVDRFEESIIALRALLDDGAVTMDGTHHHLNIADLGIRPVQDHVPFLIGGHGKRVVGLAGRHADIYQFTGLIHGEGGAIGIGGFGLTSLRDRAQRLTKAAGPRDGAIVRSALVQLTYVGDDAEAKIAETAVEWELPEKLIRATPFLLLGSTEQLVDKLERLRDELGISHYVVRDPEGFAPVVAALRGR